MTDAAARPDGGTAVPGPGTAAVATVLIAAVIAATVILVPAGEPTPATPMAARLELMDAAFASIPAWVKTWMSLQHFVFAGALLFVAWHAEARVYLLAIVGSHLISFAEIAFAPVARLGLGLVSLNHLTWLPALVILVRAWPAIHKASPWGLWSTLAIGQLLFSLTFDLRDSARYILGVLR